MVEDGSLFAAAYPNAILVPLTDVAAPAIPDLAVVIEPTTENGCSKPCWAACHLVSTTSKRRLQATSLRITLEHLNSIRHQIALAVGTEA